MRAQLRSSPGVHSRDPLAHAAASLIAWIFTSRKYRARAASVGPWRSAPQAAPGCFDLSVARAFAAGPLLGGGRTVLRHVVAHDRTRNSTQNTGMFTRKSGA
jgi:hypothetical protein